MVPPTQLKSQPAGTQISGGGNHLIRLSEASQVSQLPGGKLQPFTACTDALQEFTSIRERNTNIKIAPELLLPGIIVRMDHFSGGRVADLFTRFQQFGRQKHVLIEDGAFRETPHRPEFIQPHG